MATGMVVERATRAISSLFSGGTGSSNQSGSYCSMRRAKRIAPEVVDWPCVPMRMSALLPTASRTARTTASALSSRSRGGSRGSALPITSMSGSNFTAVKPSATCASALADAAPASVCVGRREVSPGAGHK